MERVTIATTE